MALRRRRVARAAASRMMAMAMAMLLAVVGVGMRGVLGTSNGGGSCLNTDDDRAFFIEHHGEALHTGTGDTSVVLSADTISPGCVYTVSVCSTAAFNGFLLDVKDMMSPYTRLGHFADPVSSGTAKLMPCTYADSAVTHSVPTQRTSQHFTWTAPTATPEAVHFRLFTVRSSPSDWYEIEKMVMVSDTGAACPTVPASNTCPGAGESLVPETHDHNMMDMSSMEMIMITKFNTGKWTGINIVFPLWVLDSKLSYACTLIALAVIAFMSEWLQVMSSRADRYFVLENARQQAAHVIAAHKLGTSSTPHALTATPSAVHLTVNTPPQMAAGSGSGVVGGGFVFSHRQQVMRSLLHVLRTFIGLFLMIVFMTLDVGLCMMILVGYGVGFFLFAREPHGAPDTAHACH